MSNKKSITVTILGREYTLRVHPKDEETTREIAALVNKKMRSFRQSHPNQHELTSAIITSLALAEELHSEREKKAQQLSEVNQELADLSETLASTLAADSS